MKSTLLILGLLASPTFAYSWTGECYMDGEAFAQEIAAVEYCETEQDASISGLEESGAVELCDSAAELRALESGCKDALVPAIEELYYAGECRKFKDIKDSKNRLNSLKRRLCK